MAINRYGGVSGGYGPSKKAILYRGPFFENDPGKTFAENSGIYIRAVMNEAYNVAVEAAPERDGDYLWALRYDGGARFKSEHGRKWAVTGVLSMRKLAHAWGAPMSRRGTAGRGKTRVYKPINTRTGGAFNYAGKVERKYHVFRKARAVVYAARHQQKERAMLKGIDY